MELSPIRYAHTSDGLNIAYTVRGSGPVLIEAPTVLIGNIHRLTSPAVRRFHDALARVRTLVGYDGGGYGESDDVEDVSLAAELRELDAVVSALDVERFDLFGGFHHSPIAIAYAAAHPEHVTRLILWHPWASWEQYTRYSSLPAMRSMLVDWPLYVEAASRIAAGPEEATAAELKAINLPLGAEFVRRSLESRHEIEVADLLPRIACPALVLHRSGNKMSDVRTSRAVAAAIPGARLLVLEGEGGIPPVGDDGAALRAIEAFLAEGADAPAADYAAPAPQATPANLSAREVEVLRLVADGKTNAKIAEELVISPNTVARHVKNILGKTGAANRTEAAIYAERRGLTT